MNLIQWLLEGDPVMIRLTKKHLLDTPQPYIIEGHIKNYLNLYDADKNMWGGGLYGPKWISTHYTLLELKYMEIDPHHAIYQKAVRHLLEKFG